MERENDSHMDKYLRKHLRRETPAGVPNLFYYRPTDDKGGPCHAPDCDGRSSCLLQLQRKQKTKDGQEVKHQDHFRCTITCGYCGKCRHYKDECHLKRKESEKHKKVEEARRKQWGGVIETLGRPQVKVTLQEDGGPQAPPSASSGGNANLAPRKEQRGEQQGGRHAAPPSTPTAGGGGGGLRTAVLL